MAEDANAAYIAALDLVKEMRETCETMRNEAVRFRDNVEVRTIQLRGCTDRLNVVKGDIANNIQGLRQQLTACQTALQAAQEGIGTLNPADVAANLNNLLEGFDAQLDGLDEANNQLGTEVDRACGEVDALVNDYPPAPRLGQGGGRRSYRGGWTPQPPKCRRCCGRGTKRHKKSGKCVGKKKRRKSRRRRRRRKRR